MVTHPTIQEDSTMSAPDLTSLSDQIQQLTDRQAITDLIARLGVMLDESNFDGAPAILADDVSVQTPGGSSRGPEAVVAQARRNHTVRTHHVIANVLIDLEGDRAQARANLTVTFSPDQPGSRLVINGAEQPDSRLTIGEVYRFGAVRTDGGWRLARIETARVWSSLPLPGAARVEQTGRGATPVAS
jgi:hypothetical protein